MSIAFDASYYLLQYPDVAAAVVRGQFPNAYTHFVLHGAKELRNPNAQFNAAEYAGMYPDVANAVAAGTITNVWDHYVTFGISENRAPSLALKDFDAASYLAIHTDVAAAVTAGTFKSAIDHYLLNGQAEGRTWGENISLTNGTDKLVANKFVAGLVYNPGGTDRINSLQDEDELTGIGTNPTLTATLGNSNDNGGTVITPILKGIETVNVAFTGSNGTGIGATAVHTLDLQDSTGLTKAVNITRITDELANVNIRNMTSVPAELSLSNTHSPATNVNFTFLASATAGTADATQVTLSNANVNSLKVEAHNASNGVETITLNSKGAPNSVGTFTAQDMQTLNITGDQALTIASNTVVANGTLTEAVLFSGGLANVAGSLSKIDGSTATGNLTLNLKGIFAATKDGTSGTDIAVEVLGGKGNDTFIISDVLGANDKINGGDGTNTIILTGGQIVGTAAKVQTLDIRTNAGAATVDTSKLADLATVIVRNEGNDGVSPVAAPDSVPTVVTLNKLASSVAEGAGIVIKHGTSNNNAIGSLEVAVAPATDGANDKIVYTIAEGVNADARFNVTLSSTAYETVTLKDDDSESNTVALGVIKTAGGATTNVYAPTEKLVITGATAGQFFNLDATAGGIYGYAVDGSAVGDVTSTVGGYQALGVVSDALQTKEIDASAAAANVVLRVGSYEGQKITLGNGNDTLVFDASIGRIGNLSTESQHAGLTHADSIDGGKGTDILAIDGEHTSAIVLTQSEWQNVKGFDQLTFVGNAGTSTDSVTGFVHNYAVTINDALIDSTDDGNVLVIRNDGNGNGTTAAAHEIPRNSNLLLDLTKIETSTNKVVYNGSEGGSNNAHFILDDLIFNGQHTIDGGDSDVTASTGNGNSIELRNAGTLTVADFNNLSNISTLVVSNVGSASHLASSIDLNNDVLDRLADTTAKASATAREAFTLTEIGNGAAGTAVTVNAREVTGNFDVTIDLATTNAKQSDNLSISLSADTKYTVQFAAAAVASTDLVTVYGAASGLEVRGTAAETLSYQLLDSTGTVTGQSSSFQGADVWDFSNATFNGSVRKLDFNVGNTYTSALNITGTSGNDIIGGGSGADVLTGGQGADKFVFVAGATGTPTATNFDTITDFGTGADTISYGSTAIAVGTNAGTGLTVSGGVVTAGAANLAAFVTEIASSSIAAGGALVYSDGAHSYLFITDGTVGLGANDVLVKLTGISNPASFTVVGGEITGFTFT